MSKNILSAVALAALVVGLAPNLSFASCDILSGGMGCGPGDPGVITPPNFPSPPPAPPAPPVYTPPPAPPVYTPPPAPPVYTPPPAPSQPDHNDWNNGNGNWNNGNNDWRNNNNGGNWHHSPAPAPAPAPNYGNNDYNDNGNWQRPSRPEPRPTPVNVSALCTGTFSGRYEEGTRVTISLARRGGNQVNVTVNFGKKAYRTVGTCEAIDASAASLYFAVGNPSLGHQATIQKAGGRFVMQGSQDGGGYSFSAQR